MTTIVLIVLGGIAGLTISNAVQVGLLKARMDRIHEAVNFRPTAHDYTRWKK